MNQLSVIVNKFITAIDNFGWAPFLILLLVCAFVWRLSKMLGIIAIVLVILFLFNLI